MSPTLLIAFLQDSIVSILSAKATDTVLEWWRQQPVDVAIDQTAETLRGGYDGLGWQLRDWAHRPIVAETLLKLSRGTQPATDVAVTLIRELDAVGFVAAPKCQSSEGVLLWFFQRYHAALLASEKTTYTAAFISGQIRSAK